MDVNVRMVLLAHELGMGQAAIKKISKVLIPAQRPDRRVTEMETELRQRKLEAEGKQETHLSLSLLLLGCNIFVALCITSETNKGWHYCVTLSPTV